ncbi:MAG: DUF3597 domain-containing protein [Hyphomicrobiaceae bacterium]|nr:DUF3597 domain-containing protein [Hyphomicrobiaceae bacterium]
MSIFSAIKNAIFGSPAAAAEVTPDMRAEAIIKTSASGAAPDISAAATSAAIKAAAAVATAATAATVPSKAAISKVDVAAVLDKMDEDSDEDLDWRKSIVDLMKLLKLDSSLKARKELATELKYSGDMSDSASMNVWLHKQVMTKLAENGGVVPAGLGH